MVLSPLDSPHPAKPQTGLSFAPGMVLWALRCFHPDHRTSGTKHRRGHLGRLLNGTLLLHLGPTLKAEQRLFW